MSNSHATDDLHTRILEAIQTVRQPRPKQVRPIIVIGAGGIVRAAHLPAYEKAGFPVIGLMDQQSARAAELASQRGIPRTFSSAAEAVRFAPLDAIFDVAVPASQLVHILPQFNNGATILMQKPMGETLEEARIIRDLCRKKGFVAGVNFSLRYSPNNLAVASLANAGLLGEIHDIEVQTSTYTPWHLWTFLATAPRLEILYHSIHYFDLIRSWLGNPQSVLARTLKNPHTANLAATKTIAILDYGNSKRSMGGPGGCSTHHDGRQPRLSHRQAGYRRICRARLQLSSLARRPGRRKQLPGRLHGNYGRSAILRRGISFNIAIALRRCISNHGAGGGTVPIERAPR